MNPKITFPTAEVVFGAVSYTKVMTRTLVRRGPRDNVLYGEGQLQKLMFLREVVTWPDVLDVKCR